MVFNTFDGEEAKFIQKIVEEISLGLPFISFDEKLVGMENRTKAVLSYLQTSLDDVRMIWIKGMGGAGNTTLARAVFDRLSSGFEEKGIFCSIIRHVSTCFGYHDKRRCFIHGIRDTGA